MTRFTEAQRDTLLALARAGSSDYLTHYQSRGLASLEKRGLVEQRGGRRPMGRGAMRTLSAEGERAVEMLRGQQQLGDA